MSGGGAARPPPPPAAADVARAAHHHFASLPKTGKPAGHEHTVMAAFVVAIRGEGAERAEEPPSYSLLVPVAIATGTKCLGAARRAEAAARRPPASLLHDSHAEVLARRALLLWVHAQLRQALELYLRSRGGGREPDAIATTTTTTAAATAAAAASSSSSAPLCFRWLPERRQFALRPGVELYMYVSQPPCGDASILHDDDYDDNEDDEQGASAAAPVAAVAATGGGGGERAASSAPTTTTINGMRTGAKLIEPVLAVTEAQAAAAADPCAAHAAPSVPQAGDVESPANGCQRKGALRRKPGRGDATLSMSCSDKLARWQVLGLQGALLSSLLDAPLRLSGVVASVLPAGSNGSREEDDKAGPLPSASSAAASSVERALRRAVVGRFRAAVEAAAVACEREASEAASAAATAAAAAAKLLRSSSAAAAAATFLAADPPASAHGLAPDAKRRVPTGLAVNWAAADPASSTSSPLPPAPLEVTIGALGCRAGSSRAARLARSTCSRLSRASLSLRFAELLALLEEENGVEGLLPVTAEQARGMGHDALKRVAAPAYCRAWAALLGTTAGARPPPEDEEVGVQQQHAFAGAWLRKPADGHALADFEEEEAARAARGGGRPAACGGDEDVQAAAAASSKRARVDGGGGGSPAERLAPQ
jgi:hypothetical protein